MPRGRFKLWNYYLHFSEHQLIALLAALVLGPLEPASENTDSHPSTPDPTPGARAKMPPNVSILPSHTKIFWFCDPSSHQDYLLCFHGDRTKLIIKH